MKRGRKPKNADQFKADPIPRTGEPCHHCGGSGKIEIPNEDGGGSTEHVCEWCGGTGIESASRDARLTAQDISDEMLAEICGEIGCAPKAWGFQDPKAIVAASFNVTLRHV